MREERCAPGFVKIATVDELKTKLKLSVGRIDLLVGIQEEKADLEVQDIVDGLVDQAPNRLIVLSGEPGAGKTTTSFLLARTLLLKGAKVYLKSNPTNFDQIKFQELDAYGVLDFDDPASAATFFSKPLPEGDLKRIVVSVRTAFIGKKDMKKITNDQRILVNEVVLDPLILDEVARRMVRSRLPMIDEGDSEQIVQALVKRCQRVPLYISEAVSLLAAKVEQENGYNAAMLGELPDGIRDLVSEILSLERNRDPNLMIVYYLVSHTQNLPLEYLDAFSRIYDIPEPRFLNIRSETYVSLHSWYHDVIEEEKDGWDLSFKEMTSLGAFLNSLLSQLKGKEVDATPELTVLVTDFKDHPANPKFTDLSDLLMLGASKYLADKKLPRVDSHHGFNLLTERVTYKTLKPVSVPFYHRFLGFLVNGYLSGEPLSEVISGDLRPFYCLSLFYASRLFEEKITKVVDEEFIVGTGTSVNPRELRQGSYDESVLLTAYIASLVRILEKVGYYKTNNRDLEAAIISICKLEYQKAIEQCDMAMLSNPNDLENYRWKAIALYNSAKYDECLAVDTEAMRLDPANLRNYYSKGLTLVKLGRISEALSEFQKGIELDYNYVDFHIGKAWAFLLLKRHDESLKEFDIAIGMDRDEPKNYVWKCQNYIELGRFDEALREVNTAIGLNPNNPDWRITKGYILSELERFDESIQEYYTAICLNPHDPSAHFGRGYGLYHINRLEEALRESDATIDLNPSDPDFHILRGNILSDLKKYEDGLRAYDVAIGLDPNNPDHHVSKGVTFHNMNEFEKAVLEYDIAIDMNPIDPLCHRNKSLALARLGRTDESNAENRIAVDLENVRMIETLDPNDHCTRGISFIRIKKFEEAIKELNAAIESNEEEPSYHYYKGVALNGLGKFEEASREFNIAMEPNDPEEEE
jgi:tetratricopeptide (TPR) repeat protein